MSDTQNEGKMTTGKWVTIIILFLVLVGIIIGSYFISKKYVDDNVKRALTG